MVGISDLYRSINAVDDLEAAKHIAIGRWLAWPIVKITLAARAVVSANAVSPANGVSGGILKRFTAQLGAVVRDCRLALRPALLPDRSTILLVGVRKAVTADDGTETDFFFGNLNATHWAGQSRFLSFPRIDEDKPGGDSLVSYLAHARLLAKVLMPAMLPPAYRLVRAMGRQPGGPAVGLGRAALILANFQARRILFRRFLRVSQFQTILMTYAPGRMPEIAAAQECGIPVVELQHGVFGANDPDYGWSASLRPSKERMPLPNRVAVFGSHFRDLMLAKGFWDARDVVIAGCAAIDNASAGPIASRERPSVRFFSQPLFHAVMRDLLLNLCREPVRLADFDCELVLHPEETDGEEFYGPLNRVWPTLKIIRSRGNPLPLIASADAIVACNSLALLEACGMGRLAISLTRPGGGGGLSDMMSDPTLEQFVPHVESSSDLVALLLRLSRGELDGQRAELSSLGKALYAAGWHSRMRAILADVAKEADRPGRSSADLQREVAA
ncbi:hypothetical protein ASE66_13530 [Bosea sp. Root483D1]|uniref:hypothetical protein n=1 Tax=Bosea sp. Root483D1 TaxID=1736544 RepID=UPI00070A8FA8|nr:hypothetical protein [Bosea sp. Root483D1]KRE14398.1 hypothetical protein ASE66_13530 [Bosea sp. Root483D1]